MKPPPHDDRGWNSPAEMLVRATFLAVLGGVTIGILLMAAGVFAADPRLSLAGIVVLGAAAAGRTWLQRRSESRGVEAALEAVCREAPPLDESRGRHLLALLEEWESMEEKRGSPEFDPWALQVLRNDIRRVVESDPALTRLFAELQRAA